MFRAWPAPLTVALPGAGARFPAGWPGPIRERLTAGGLVRFRCPDHPLIDAAYPAVVTDGRCAPTLVAETFLPSAAAVVERLGDAVGVAVSAGDVPTGGRPTVVLVNPNGWEVIEQGAFEAAEVQRLAARIVLFVCTGNTCRSPLAEGLAKRLLAERLNCTPDDLPARGVWVLSAGVAAYGGGPAAPETLDVALEHGVDLREHRSRPVNPQLLAAADDVVAMTRSHAHAIAMRYPGVGPAVRLLCGDDADLDDPIGASLDVYRQCARTILTHLERFIPEWVGP
jgi:protein-tyrosine phosphatase